MMLVEVLFIWRFPLRQFQSRHQSKEYITHLTKKSQALQTKSLEVPFQGPHTQALILETRNLNRRQPLYRENMTLCLMNYWKTDKAWISEQKMKDSTVLWMTTSRSTQGSQACLTIKWESILHLLNVWFLWKIPHSLTRKLWMSKVLILTQSMGHIGWLTVLHLARCIWFSHMEESLITDLLTNLQKSSIIRSLIKKSHSIKWNRFHPIEIKSKFLLRSPRDLIWKSWKRYAEKLQSASSIISDLKSGRELLRPWVTSTLSIK